MNRLGQIFTVAILAASCGGAEESKVVTTTNVPANADDARFATLKALRATTSPEAIAGACDEHAVSALPPDLRERCASAHFDFARDLIQREDAKSARQALNRARDEGMPPHRVVATERDLKALEKKAEMREGMARREDAAHRVANVFQYRGLQARAQLGGEYKEDVTLEDPTFNAEIVDQLRNDEYVLGPLREAGAKSVTFTDGSGYSATVKLE